MKKVAMWKAAEKIDTETLQRISEGDTTKVDKCRDAFS